MYVYFEAVYGPMIYVASSSLSCICHCSCVMYIVNLTKICIIVITMSIICQLNVLTAYNLSCELFQWADVICSWHSQSLVNKSLSFATKCL